MQRKGGTRDYGNGCRDHKLTAELYLFAGVCVNGNSLRVQRLLSHRGGCIVGS